RAKAMKTQNNPSSTSKPGQPIKLHPALEQPENLFTPKTYREFIELVMQIEEERYRLRVLMSSKYATAKKRNASSEYRQDDFLRSQSQIAKQEYFQRLPNHLLAICPYCHLPILQPVDHFSLMGFDPSLNIQWIYSRHEEVAFNPPRQWCVNHQLFTRVYVNLHGMHADDLPPWAVRGKWPTIFVHAPILIVWPLIARQTSAVIHALPIGRLDDPEPIHRYTAYFVTYFLGNESNLHTEEMHVSTDRGGPATDGVQFDTDLVKWVKAGRLYWLDPANPERLVKGPVETFPYANVQPQGWYQILEGGRINGPNPYYQVWQGEAPPHDVSFPKTIE
ncbi:MAG: hypothetical protein KKD28_15815, partial [Chloroflexi bacterium]|nr:hypothetical protein [Chloroflexota bacterium]